jgi:1-acyl-sn-glycerol-3-phosphate acyltransferase
MSFWIDSIQLTYTISRQLAELILHSVYNQDMHWVEKRQQQALGLDGNNMRVYRWVLLILGPVFRLCFRPVVTGAEYIPLQGAAIITANHKSFWDSAFQAMASPRPIRWMGKSELFRNPLIGRLCVQLGAFPVVRGQSDSGAIATAQALLQAGELVALFPEGTRVRNGLGQPKRGAARLALEAGVDTIPMSIVGTQRGELRRALWRRGACVRITIHPPVAPLVPEQQQDEPEAAGRLMRELVWPKIKDGVQGLESHRRQALAAGLGAALVAGVGLHLKRKKR